jgi:hypothetical protein
MSTTAAAKILASPTAAQHGTGRHGMTRGGRALGGRAGGHGAAGHWEAGLEAAQHGTGRHGMTRGGRALGGRAGGSTAWHGAAWRDKGRQHVDREGHGRQMRGAAITTQTFGRCISCCACTVCVVDGDSASADATCTGHARVASI